MPNPASGAMGCDDALAWSGPVHNHVAREQKADLQVGAECAVGQRWVTRTQDYVLAELSIELRLERLWTSIVVRMPNPWPFSASVARARASSYGMGNETFSPESGACFLHGSLRSVEVPLSEAHSFEHGGCVDEQR
jgi:hypothetical protein